MEDNEPTNEEILASLEQEQPQEKSEKQPEVVAETEKPTGYTFADDNALFGHKLKYTASGKEVEEPISDILKRASQGYHYSQRMSELKAQESQWQKQLEEYKGVASKYRDIDEYARQNPEWFDYWNNAYQNRSLPVGSTGQQGGFDPAQITSLIDQKLAPFQETIQQQRERMEQEKRQKEDADLDSQVQKTYKEFSDIDFTATDPSTGVSLEHKVYQFMLDNRLNDFNKAYKLMDYDNIMSRQQERAKAELVKQEQMKRKQGIVGETSVQGKKPVAQQDLRRMTPDQFEQVQFDYLQQLRQGG
jgi:hypothetical protein